MNIIKSQGQDRNERIKTILLSLEKSFNAGLAVNAEKFIATCSLELGISRRTAIEYIKTICSAKGYDWVAGIISGPLKTSDLPEEPKQKELKT